MDIGSTMTLDRYASDRFGKGLMMAAGTDGLNWVYQLGGGGGLDGDQDGLVGSVISRMRGLGMGFVGLVPGLKEFIMRRAE